MSAKIKQYFQDYGKWFPDEWRWELATTPENRERYMKYRARKSSPYQDNDIIPDFTSIEKDANRFPVQEVTFTDIFGIVWRGSKGRFRSVGDADYEQHMYYFPEEDDEEYIDEETAVVSEDVTADKIPAGYAQLNHSGIKMFLLMEDITDIEYHYIVENHLFKDSYVTIAYGGTVKDDEKLHDGDGEYKTIHVFDIRGMAAALKKFKPELHKKFLSQVNNHFKDLQESKYENEREFAPTKRDGAFMTAEEYFDDATV